jgi:hypothetical protein
MRKWWIGLGVVVGACGVVLPLCWGQGPGGPEQTPAGRPAVRPVKFAPVAPAHDISKLPLQQQQLYRSAQAGTDWLLRVNRSDGRFLSGIEPALRVPLEKENYIHQAAAAFTLARSARFFNDERAAAVARQSLLTLLLETEKDTSDPKIRRPVPVSPGTHPLEAAGWLVLAIHELPAPGEDLLGQAEELCNYIRSRQRADGSLSCAGDPGGENKDMPEAVKHYTGAALYGVARSLNRRTDDGKTAMLRKALSYYREFWRKHKNTEMVPWHAAAFGEAYLVTKEQGFADFANEMNDWVCTLQHRQPDPRRPLWQGGFKSWHDGQAQMTAPDVHGAAYMEALFQGCRVARQTGDLQRYQNYKEALEACGTFVARLQYTTANTQHFADWYRQDLVGGFHASHQNGGLRLDYTQVAVAGLVGYLRETASGS